jgi:hypothetical protein
MSRRQLLLSVLLLVGCAGPRTPAPAPAVAYAAPATAPVYAATDTVQYVIQAGDMGGVETRSGYTATMRLAFEPDSGDYRVTATLVRFAGTFSSAMAGSVTADEKAVGGPFVVRVTPLGKADLVHAPSLSDAFEQVTGAEALVRNFFVRLPGRPVRAGDTWTDTIHNRDVGADMTTDSRSILTATVTGDTAVQGRTLLLVHTTYENTVHVSGASGGTEITQNLQGVTTGTFLWDVERHLLTERAERGRLDGTLDLPGMSVAALPVHASVYRHVRLLPATPD